MDGEHSAPAPDTAWWTAWRTMDFTWAGLATHEMGVNGRSIHGGAAGERTLQEYWRRDPETGRIRDDSELLRARELEECGGEIFHIAHLPDRDRAGAATWKSDLLHQNWERLDTLLAARLAKAEATAVDWKGEPTAADGRAQLVGVVLRAALPASRGGDFHVHAARSVTLGDADYSAVRFGPGACFSHALFCGQTRFTGSTFDHNPVFDGAEFRGEVALNRVETLGDARLVGMRVASRLRLDGGRFRGTTNFDDCVFGESVNALGAVFDRTASFMAAEFGGEALFANAVFGGNARFLRARFKRDARFEGAEFSSRTRFRGAMFERDARFEGASFVIARFEEIAFAGETHFDGGAFAGPAQFDSSSFQRAASFERVSFREPASFENCRFSELAWFRRASFARDSSFERAEFSAFASFAEVKAEGPVCFRAAVFEKLVSFEDFVWPAAPRDWHAAFNQALFRGTCAFRGAGVRAFAAFDGATFERGLLFDDMGEDDSDALFDQELRGAMAAARSDAGDGARTSRETLQQLRSRRVREVERGCRVLKQAMEKASNKAREQVFYRYELMARRAQAETPLWERFFSYLYEWTSNYGASIARPLGVLLIGVIPLFTMGFWLWAAGLDRLHPVADIGADPLSDFFAALRFAWTNAFYPFSALSNDILSPGDTSWVGAALTQFGAGWSFCIRATATLQSVISLVLIFLSGLAIRRRFQIN